MTEKDLEGIKIKAEDLLLDLQVQAEVKVDFDQDLGLINIQIDSVEAAMLIGFHGETLQALQLILSFMVHQLLGEWTKVVVNVGDYRQKREEQLRKLALSLAMKVKFSGEAQGIPNLSPGERRLVHIILADHPDVRTESEGEGRERQLVIKPKV